MTGLVVALPLWITWAFLVFVVRIVSSVGGAPAHAVVHSLAETYPMLSAWLLQPWVQTAAAAALVVASLLVVGWMASVVIGRKAVAAFDRLMGQIPFLHVVYGSTKKLLATLQQNADTIQRVVLIEFPSPEMKAIGFVTRTFVDEDSGQELAAVYIPTTPNPTSGYVEIVPQAKVVPLDWTINDAMAFVMSGGAVGPHMMVFSKRLPSEPGDHMNLRTESS